MSHPLNHTVRLATRAMATRFELVLNGSNPVALRSAGEAALKEIDRIGSRFSFYNPSSELSRINANAFRQPVPVSGDLFELLQLCAEIHAATSGFFDPTVGPLMRLWDFSPTNHSRPSVSDIAVVMSRTGWQNVRLNEQKHTIQFLQSGVQIDLGGIAKGWALDEAATLLMESGVTSALLHGGTSSIRAIGGTDTQEPWKIGIEDPYIADNAWFTTHSLRDSSLSVSAIAGKQITVDHVEYGHIVNPKSGSARSGPFLSIVESPSAALADGWSTAVLARETATSLFIHHEDLAFWLWEKKSSGWETKKRD